MSRITAPYFLRIVRILDTNKALYILYGVGDPKLGVYDDQGAIINAQILATT